MPLIEIKNRYTGEVIYSAEALSLRKCLELAAKDNANLADANLADAYLSGANLAGANLAGAYLRDNIKISQVPIQVSTTTYYVTIYDAHMQIGCKLFSLAEWWAFDDRAIAEMDGKQALKWWARWKGPLQAICEAEGRG